MIKLNNLNPFGKLCVTLGMIPSSYKESMTYEEQLLWMFKYLDETLIPRVNEQSEAINGLNDLYVQLKEYVDNYFDNLDVQEEINNKLDSMVEDGTFDELFAELETTIGDVSDLKTTYKSDVVGAINEIVDKSITLHTVNYSSSPSTNNFTLESDVDSITGTLYYNDILESISILFSLKSTFALTGGTRKLLATLQNPTGHSIRDGHSVIVLDNGEACDCVISTDSDGVKIYVKSPNSYTAGTLSSARVVLATTLNYSL